MAYTLAAPADEVLTLEQFTEFLEHSIDVDDLDDFCRAAPAFRALLNNRSLISDVVARELRQWRDFQNGNGYVATTLILERRPKFFIRANMWFPDQSGLRGRGYSAVYGLTHDHNFTFMTGGYHGPGYTTEIYETDGRARGNPGERVNLDFLERTMLPEGKIMVYRAMQDVHRQSRPDAMSVSINVVVPTQTKKRPQYFYDVDRGEITRTEYIDQGRTLSLFTLAKYAGNAATHGLLTDIALTAANKRLRTAAYDALCECAPHLAAETAERSKDLAS